MILLETKFLYELSRPTDCQLCKQGCVPWKTLVGSFKYVFIYLSANKLKDTLNRMFVWAIRIWLRYKLESVKFCLCDAHSRGDIVWNVYTDYFPVHCCVLFVAECKQKPLTMCCYTGQLFRKECVLISLSDQEEGERSGLYTHWLF
jgi:hypothetical protein